MFQASGEQGVSTLILKQDQRQTPWNKGRLVDQKPPLKPKEVWNIRGGLQIDGRWRDLAMFNLAIHSKLRGCDLVRLKIDDLRSAACCDLKAR
jgi:hypothetical protein